MLDQVRTIDNRRFLGDKLTSLLSEKLMAIEELWQIVLGLAD